MATIDNASIVRGLYDAFNAKDLNRALSSTLPDAKAYNNAFGATLSIKDYLQNWMTGFPDAKVEVKNLTTKDDVVIAECVGRGKHAGPLEGPGIAVPPTNKPVELKFVEVFELRQGKVAAVRMYFDSGDFMAQLGLAQKRPSAAEQPQIAH